MPIRLHMEVSPKADSPPSREPPGDRRSKRVVMSVPVVVSGIGDDNPFEETTQTLVESEHGCSVEMKTPLVKGQQMRILNAKTKEEVICAVAFLGDTNPGGRPKWASSLESLRLALGRSYFRRPVGIRVTENCHRFAKAAPWIPIQSPQSDRI